MVDQIFIKGDLLLRAICPYYPRSNKALSAIYSLQKNGAEIYYSADDLKTIRNYLETVVRTASVILDHYPRNGSGLLQIQVARLCKSPELMMYIDYTSFDAFLKDIMERPKQLGLMEIN